MTFRSRRLALTPASPSRANVTEGFANKAAVISERLQIALPAPEGGEDAAGSLP